MENVKASLDVTFVIQICGSRKFLILLLSSSYFTLHFITLGDRKLINNYNLPSKILIDDIILNLLYFNYYKIHHFIIDLIKILI